MPSAEPYLTPRLFAICKMAKGAEKTADIGTDHAYVPIYLIERYGIKSALACDINTGPLMRADGNILKFNLSDKIKTRQSDGLKNVSVTDADTVIIAGMGGTLIAQILEDAPHMKKSSIRFILQPMTAICELRKYLSANGYEITDEAMCAEGEKLYTVMSVIYTGDACKEEKELYFHIGKKLIEKRDTYLLRLIENKIAEHEKIAEGLKKAFPSQARNEKYEYCKKLLTEFYNLKKELKNGENS